MRVFPGGSSFKLRFTQNECSELCSVDSAEFDVPGQEATLEMRVQPSLRTSLLFSGQHPVVGIVGREGQLLTDANADITVTVEGTSGEQFTEDSQVVASAVGGLATFSTLAALHASDSVRLKFHAVGFKPVLSNVFSVPGSLRVLVQPVPGAALQVEVGHASFFFRYKLLRACVLWARVWRACEF